MLKDVAGIRINGGIYSTDADLLFFDPMECNKIKKVKGAIIYGRNGSGKSTIAKGIKQILKGTEETEENKFNKVEFIDEKKAKTELSETEKENVYVFDEEYVNENVKLQENGLGTIVMLGDLADLTDKLETAQKEFAIAEENKNKSEAELNEYKDKNNSKSPLYYLSRMHKVLSGDKNWAGRARQINKDQKSNSPVKDDTFKQFVLLRPSKTRDELIIDFDTELKKLRDAETGISKITAAIPTIPNCYEHFDVSKINELVSLKIEKPQLSEREQYLMELLQKGEADSLQKNVNIFKSPDTHFCPMCLQDVTHDHKEKLVASIEKVLSKKVEEHQEALKKALSESLSLDLSEFDRLKSCEACKKAIDSLNNAIDTNNRVLNSKISDPYTIPTESIADISPLAETLKQEMQKLSEELTEYNKNITDTSPIIAELKRINSEIAHYDIKEYYDKYRTQSKEQDNKEAEYNTAKTIHEEKKKAVDDIEEERKKTRIALEVLNEALKYIFFSEKRLSVELSDDKYKLLVNNNPVKPCDVSVGERNILGLCYFFTDILKEKEKSQGYKGEYLIVIDDPVSSFDFENKVGILSYLKHQLNLFLTENSDTRVLLLTHDLTTYFDLNKVLEETLKKCTKIFSSPPLKYNRYELSNQLIVPFQNKRHEYTELINTIYKYANGNATEYDIVIGNIMRQVLEAFSTFTYKKPIEEISTDLSIMNNLDQKYKDYFENLMYRLVLHGGSHREEQTKSFELEFFSLISENEKRRTAKDILTFIYLLNKKHLLSHLSDSNAESGLETWCNNILSS